MAIKNFKIDSTLSFLSCKLFHQISDGYYTFYRQCIVHRDTETANAAMALYADHSFSPAEFQKFLFQNGIVNYKRCIH